jgi:hypothetical protein
MRRWYRPCAADLDRSETESLSDDITGVLGEEQEALGRSTNRQGLKFPFEGDSSSTRNDAPLKLSQQTTSWRSSVPADAMGRFGAL